MLHQLDTEDIVRDWIQWVLKAVFTFMFTQVTPAKVQRCNKLTFFQIELITLPLTKGMVFEFLLE